MEQSESSINRFGRTMWTVWGYLSGAVARYLQPEVTDEANESETFKQEETAATVTTSKSVKDPKETDEERTETKPGTQSERVQSGVNVRTAAVQWEKSHVRRDATRKRTHPAVGRNVQEERLEDGDEKEVEQRGNENNLDINDEALRTKSHNSVEGDQVSPASSTDTVIVSQDFDVSRSVEARLEARTSENIEDDLKKRTHVGETVHSKVGDQAAECGVEDEEEIQDDPRSQGMAEDRDGQDLLSQSVDSVKESGDLLKAPLHTDLQVEETTILTPQREAPDVSNEETKEETVGTLKDVQPEPSQQLAEVKAAGSVRVSGLNLDETQSEAAVETECQHLEEPVMEHASVCDKDLEPIGKTTENKAVLTPEREMTSIFSEETNQETVGTVESSPLEEDELLSEFVGSENAGVSESKLDDSQVELAQATVETECQHLEETETLEKEPICKIIENKAVLTPEWSEIDVRSDETKQETVGTVKDVQQEASQQLTEVKAAEIFGVSESKLDESQLAEATVETECELVEEPVNENAETYEKDVEPIGKTIENKSVLIPEIEEFDVSNEVTVESSPQEEHKQLSEFVGSEIVGVSESKLNRTQVEITVETGCQHLEELVIENAEICEKNLEPIRKTMENKAILMPEREVTNIFTEETEKDAVGTVEFSPHKDELLSEFVGSEIVGVSESKLDKTQLAEAAVETGCQLLVESVMENAETREKDIEPIGTTVENKAVLTPEREVIDVCNEETKQETVGTVKNVIHEASQQLTELNIVGNVGVSESKLYETQLELAETTVEAECHRLEEPVMDNAEICEEDLEPIGKTTENKDILTLETEEINVNNEVTKQETVGTVESSTQEEPKQLSEFVGSEIVGVFESKLDRTQLELVEAKVETGCQHLEEPVIENAEICEKPLEPIGTTVENKAVLMPEREVTHTFTEETEKDSVGTVESSPHKDELLSVFVGSENVDQLDDGCTELTVELVEAEYEEPVSSQIDNDEIYQIETESICKSTESESAPELISVITEEIHDALESNLNETEGIESVCELLEARQMENREIDPTSLKGLMNVPEDDHVEPVNDDVESPNILKMEKRLDDLTESEMTEVVIEHDDESVSGPVDVEATDQKETLETTTTFRQGHRAEVVSAEVKKSAEIEGSLHEVDVDRDELPLQESMGQTSLEQRFWQEKSELLEAKESNSAEQVHEGSVEPFDEVPRPSFQDKSIETSIGLVEETKSNSPEQELEAFETELPVVSKHHRTEKHDPAEPVTTTSKTEHESSLATSEVHRKSIEVNASLSDVSQSRLEDDGESTVEGSSAETESHQLQTGRPGSSDLLESDSELIQRHLQKDSGEPVEAETGLQDELKVKITSLGEKSDLAQEPEELLKENPGLEEKTVGRQVETDSKFSNINVEDKKRLKAETTDIKHEECAEEVPEHVSSERPELLPVGHQDNAPVVGEGDETKGHEEKVAVIDGNENIQERSRPGLKRVFEKMARDENKPSMSKTWGTDLLQVSSLDCTVQKSKILVKNPHVRPPKDPRTLINMASVEPLAPTRSLQPSPLRKSQAEGLSVPQKGVIGFKLPGLGAGVPVLRKTEAGRKMREGENTACVSAQESDTRTDPKDDNKQVKQEQPASKPRWTPPRHPGMGSPLMMSELKSKLKKTGTD